MPKIPQRIDSRVYVGIDPGEKGGIAVIRDGELFAWTMPTTEKDLWFLISDNVDLETSKRRTCAVIEKVGVMPEQGCVSAFTFGRGVGLLEMALIAAEIPYEEVKPQVWQKAFTISSRKKQGGKTKFKEHLLSIAQKLYPKFPLWGIKNTKGRQLAVADAILMATYLQRRDRSS